MTATGQKTTRIIIDTAQIGKLVKVHGVYMNHLIGDVVLHQDSTYFYCDSGWIDNSTNNLEAFGNIHIMYSDSVDLYGRFLTYDGNTRIAILDSDVVLRDNRATLYTDHLIYDRKNRIASYNTGGMILDEKNVLTSRKGRYFTDTRDFYFSDSVVVTNPDYCMYSDTLRYNTLSEIAYIYGPTNIIGDRDHIYSEDGWYDTRNDKSLLRKNNQIDHEDQILKADSIFYDGGRGYGKAIGNIWMKDTARNVIMTGAISEFYRARHYSYLTGKSEAILIDKGDSLFMHADTFRLILDTAEKARLLLAYRHIKFFRRDLQGMCDSLVYRVKDSVISMYVEPVLWTRENQLTSDSILMYVNNNRIDSMALFNMAFIISQDTKSTYDQIKGKQMRGYFRDDELYRINVIGNAETIYFLREENGAMIGINKLVSSDMAILLEDGKLKSIKYYTQPDGTMYPEEDLAKDQQVLKGFEWLKDDRPIKREDIFKERSDLSKTGLENR